MSTHTHARPDNSLKFSSTDVPLGANASGLIYRTSVKGCLHECGVPQSSHTRKSSVRMDDDGGSLTVA